MTCKCFMLYIFKTGFIHKLLIPLALRSMQLDLFTIYFIFRTNWNWLYICIHAVAWSCDPALRNDFWLEYWWLMVLSIRNLFRNHFLFLVEKNENIINSSFSLSEIFRCEFDKWVFYFSKQPILQHLAIINRCAQLGSTYLALASPTSALHLPVVLLKEWWSV